MNLLRIISSICDASEEQGGLLARYGLLDAIRGLENDPAILVRDMAGKLLQSNERSEAYSLGKRKPGVRRRSTSTTPPSLLANQSAPSTPQINRGSQSKGFFEGRESQRHPRNALSGSALVIRPGSRDGVTPGLVAGLNGNPGVSRNRVPRVSNRLSHVDLLAEEDGRRPSSASRRPSILPRRRHTTQTDAEWTP